MSNLSLKQNTMLELDVDTPNFGENYEYFIIERFGFKIGFMGLVDQSYVFSTVNSKKLISNSYLDVAE